MGSVLDQGLRIGKGRSNCRQPLEENKGLKAGLKQRKK